MTKIAFLYDFDRTLTSDDMQNQGFLQKCGVEDKASISAFWQGVGDVVEKDGMDKYIAFMYCMLKQAKKSGVKVTEKLLQQCGKGIKFFSGVEGWFDMLNKYALAKNLEAEHYIISSGNREIIQGTCIAKYFKRIYASYFHYDENGIADWPGCTINYTNKTQFLYRVKKQVLNMNDEGVNKKIDESDIEIPFDNMVYIGDSDTDIPCMEIIKHSGGASICVFSPSEKGEVAKKAADMLKDDRVNYCAEADYTKDGKLWQIVKKLIDKVAITSQLLSISSAQCV